MFRPKTFVFLLIALVLDVGIAYVHLVIPEQGMAVLLVLATAMFLGVAHPKRPWLWIPVVGLCLPAADLYVYLHRQPVFRGTIEGSIVSGLLAAFVGAFAGSMMRRMMANVFNERS